MSNAVCDNNPYTLSSLMLTTSTLAGDAVESSVHDPETWHVFDVTKKSWFDVTIVNKELFVSNIGPVIKLTTYEEGNRYKLTFMVQNKVLLDFLVDIKESGVRRADGGQCPGGDKLIGWITDNTPGLQYEKNK